VLDGDGAGVGAGLLGTGFGAVLGELLSAGAGVAEAVGFADELAFGVGDGAGEAAAGAFFVRTRDAESRR